MDGAALLGLLLVLVVLDTVTIGGLLVVTLHDRRASRGQPPASWPAPSGTEATRAAAEAPRAAADPLADAITAFLDRPDGLFRTGSAGRSVASGPPPAVPGRPPAVPGPPPAVPGLPPAVPGLPPAVPGLPPAVPGLPPAVPGPPSAVPGPPSAVPGPAPAPRPDSDDRRPATTPPSRYVASGTSASVEPGRGAGAVVPSRPFAPVAGPAAGPAGGMRTADRRPAMRLDVGLVGRDARSATARGAAIRLGPVIGGLLRERTRAGDTVVASGPGRFAAILPDASRAGAAALAERLEAGCDAWLAAELPPLRLELAIGEQPGGLPPAPPAPSRVVDPDRRRSIRSAT